MDASKCLEDLRRVSEGALRAHFRHLRNETGLPSDPYEDMEEILLSHWRSTRDRYSFTLEFSRSDTQGASSSYRFSYAFPAFGEGREKEETAACVALFQPFGQAVADMAQRLLDVVKPAAMNQILMGLDAALSGNRYKLYFQFSPGEAAQKLAFCRRLLPANRLKTLADSIFRLHLAGVDFSERGVFRVKLYFLFDPLNGAVFASRYGKTHLFGILGDFARDGLRDFLEIHRLGAGGKPEGLEIDLGLLPNHLTAEDFLKIPTIATSGSNASNMLENSCEDRRHVVNRLSLSIDDSHKLNLYYRIVEPEDRG